MSLLLGEGRPLGLAWLFFHLLLWMQQETTLAKYSPHRLKGEPCRFWNYTPVGRRSVFWCPNSLKGANLRFCCGSCSAPYCCSSKRDQLDQTLCVPTQALERITTTTPIPTPTPILITPHGLPVWTLLNIFILCMIALLPIGCGIKTAVRFCLRRYHRWRIFQNQVQDEDYTPLQPRSLLPVVTQPQSVHEYLPCFCPYCSREDYNANKILLPIPGIPPDIKPGYIKVGHEEDQTQPDPSPHSKSDGAQVQPLSSVGYRPTVGCFSFGMRHWDTVMSAINGPKDIPPYSVATSHDLQSLPCALDRPPVLQILGATHGATEDKMVSVSPEDLNFTAGGSILDLTAGDPIVDTATGVQNPVSKADLTPASNT